MFLTKDSKSPFYQLVYFVDGKRTKVSTKTADKFKAEVFKATFNPASKQQNKYQYQNKFLHCSVLSKSIKPMLQILTQKSILKKLSHLHLINYKNIFLIFPWIIFQ